ncbi:MAG: S41 family peptidase, partial [Bacteroidota bacterium]
VLIDGFTASSGEATTLALMKDSRARTFGQSTCGLTTSNQAFPLSDGSTLVLSTGFMAKADGTIFQNGIKPSDNTPPGDATINAAVRWIRE